MSDRIVQSTLDQAERVLELYGDKQISADVLLVDLRKKARDMQSFDAEIAEGLARFAAAVQAAKAHDDAWMRIVDVRRKFREWRRVLRRKAAGVATTEEMVALAEQGMDRKPEAVEPAGERAARHAAMLAAAERVKAEAEARVAASVEAAMEASRQATQAARAEIDKVTKRQDEAADMVRAAEDAVRARGESLGAASAEEAPPPEIAEADYASAIAEIESLLSSALDEEPAPEDKERKL